MPDDYWRLQCEASDARVAELEAALREVESVGAYTAENCEALAAFARTTLESKGKGLDDG
jgi:hypothetical protein